MAAVNKLGWKLTALAFAVPMGFAARKAVATGWKLVRGEEPREPGEQGTGWGEALAWAAISGVAIAAAELLAARAAATAWRSITGTEPPGHETDLMEELEG